MKISAGKNEILIDSEDYSFLSAFSFHLDSNGVAYTHVSVPQLLLKIHDGEIFFKNGNKLDYRKENIMIISHQEQSFNRKKQVKPTSSVYKGVHFHNVRKKWRASIKHNYKQIYIGSFSNEKDAAAAYNEKALELFGEFARLNVLK